MVTGEESMADIRNHIEAVKLLLALSSEDLSRAVALLRAMPSAQKKGADRDPRMPVIP